MLIESLLEMQKWGLSGWTNLLNSTNPITFLHHRIALALAERRKSKHLQAASLTRGAAFCMILAMLHLCFIIFFASYSLTEGFRSTFNESSSSNVAVACRATRFPDLCELTLASSKPQALSNAAEIIQRAMQVASKADKHSHGLAQTLQRARGSVNLSEAATECEYFLRRANSLLIRSQHSSLSGRIEDIQAWMSAALTYQNDCWSALSYVNTTRYVIQMMEQIQYVISLTSNALSMVGAYRIYGENTRIWLPPNKETLSFTPFRWIGPSDRHLLEAPLYNLKPSFIVSNDAKGDFSTIQAAVDAAPAYSRKRFVIYIKEGIYKEQVIVSEDKTFLVFVGDGMSKTIITGDRNAQIPGVTTFSSATVAINGDGFLCRDLSFENTAGPENHQAVALRVDSDFSMFYRCSFLGYQDTLYVHSFRQFYKDCKVEGTIDFIFGDSAAIFQNCEFSIRPGRPQAKMSTVTAQGRTDPAETTALVLQNCSVRGTEAYMKGLESNPERHQAYLGRPWKLYSRTIFIHTYLGSLIRPEGWFPFRGDFALNTLFYGEYEDYGPGANATGRVAWSSQLTRAEALYFTVSWLD